MIHHLLLDDKKPIFSSYLREDIINLADQTFIIPKDFKFKVVEVTPEYIARPDLISIDLYGDNTYTDILCKLNGISNPFELNIGDKIVAPDNTDLYKFYYTPTKEECDSDDNQSLNNLKKKIKNEIKKKREPNEGLLNDNRFKIDKKNGIIIY